MSKNVGRYCTGCSSFTCGGLCGDGGEKFSFRKGRNKSVQAQLPFCCKGLLGPETFPPITTYSKDYTDVHHVPPHGVPLLIRSQLLKDQLKPKELLRFKTEYNSEFDIPSQKEERNLQKLKIRRNPCCRNEQFISLNEATYIDHFNTNTCDQCKCKLDYCACSQTYCQPYQYEFSNDFLNPYPQIQKSTCTNADGPPPPRLQKYDLIKPGTEDIFCQGCPCPEVKCPFPDGERALCETPRCFEDLRKQVITPPRMYPPVYGSPRYVEDPNNPIPPRRPRVLMYQSGSFECPGPATRFPMKFTFTKTDDPEPWSEPRDDYALSFTEYTFPKKEKSDDDEDEKPTNDSIFPVPKKKKTKIFNKNGKDTHDATSTRRAARDPYKPTRDPFAENRRDSTNRKDSLGPDPDTTKQNRKTSIGAYQGKGDSIGSESDVRSSFDKRTAKKENNNEPDDPNTVVPKNVVIPPPGIPPYCAELCGPPKDPRPAFNHLSTYDVDYYWNKKPPYKRFGKEITDVIPVKPLCYPGTIDASIFQRYRSEETERFGDDWKLNC